MPTLGQVHRGSTKSGRIPQIPSILGGFISYLSRNSVLALQPEPVSKLVESERNGNHECRDASQDRYRIVRAQVRVEGHADDRHAAGGEVPDQRYEGERGRGEDLVRVDDVHVGAEEDAGDAEAEEGGGDDRRPDADLRVIGPGHPEQGDRDSERGAELFDVRSQ